MLRECIEPRPLALMRGKELLGGCVGIELSDTG
jgi:hypothetical protein